MSNANIAATRLQMLVKNHGLGFLTMKGSVKAFLMQQLSEFPEEKAVLEAAYNHDIHTQVNVPPGANREDHLTKTAERFAKQAGVHPEWATWAVQTWSIAVENSTPRKQSMIPGLPEQQFQTAVPVPGKSIDHQIHNRYDEDNQLKILHGGSPIWFRFLMTILVASGGLFGAFIGRNAPIAAILIGFDVVDSTVGKEKFEEYVPKQKRLSTSQKVVGYAILFVINGGVVSLACCAMSALGWCFGKADGRPWLGFSACFGAAFGMNFIFSLLSCGICIGLVISSLGCFAAGFKSAVTTN